MGSFGVCGGELSKPTYSNGIVSSIDFCLPRSYHQVFQWLPDSLNPDVVLPAYDVDCYVCAKGDDARSCSESERLSDIDDTEVDSYLNNEEEKYYKKIIWEKLNLKYLQEQEAKKSAANVPKPKKERQKKVKEVKKDQPTAQMSMKRASSRVNYDALSKLLDEPSPSDNPKRSKTESNSDQNVERSSFESPSNDEEVGANQNDYDEDNWEENPDYSSYYNNQDEEYDDYYVEDDTF